MEPDYKGVLVTGVVSLIAMGVWLKATFEAANYTIANPTPTIMVMLAFVAVFGGVLVSLVPQFVWSMMSTEEIEDDPDEH